MYEAASDASHCTQLAISREVPQRRKGVLAPCSLSCFDSDSVSIQPGATQLTVMPKENACSQMLGQGQGFTDLMPPNQPQERERTRKGLLSP